MHSEIGLASWSNLGGRVLQEAVGFCRTRCCNSLPGCSCQSPTFEPHEWLTRLTGANWRSALYKYHRDVSSNQLVSLQNGTGMGILAKGARKLAYLDHARRIPRHKPCWRDLPGLTPPRMSPFDDFISCLCKVYKLFAEERRVLDLRQQTTTKENFLRMIPRHSARILRP